MSRANQLLLATANLHKQKELQVMLAGSGWNIYTLRDYPHIELPPETGMTFEANARIKALAAAKASGLLSLADDSGLTVDALDGAPGIYSARFAGEEKNDSSNNAKLLELLTETPPGKRQAAFVCAIVIADPQGQTWAVQAFCQGEIALTPSGKNGFGYDPLFYLPQFDCTMAQLSDEEKNKISHRGQALTKALSLLEQIS